MNRMLFRSLAMMVLLVGLAGPAMSEEKAATTTPPVHPPLVMCPGDELVVTVVNYPNHSGAFPVEVTGEVDIPLTGRIHVGGLTGAAAQELVRDEIWRAMPSEPTVRIVDTHRVSVLGEVKLPGLYQVTGTERVADLVARAGGTTTQAQLSRVRVTREDGSSERDLRQELSGGRQTLSEIGLRSGDIIFVPTRPAILDWRNWAIIVSSIASTILIVDRIREP